MNDKVKATPGTPIPPNNVQSGDDIQERVEQLCCIIQQCGNMIPYNFDGCLTLEQKFMVLMRAVQDNMLNQEQLLNTWKDVYNWINDYFTNLDVQDEINNKLDQIIASGQFEEILNQYFSYVDERITKVEGDLDQTNNNLNNLLNRFKFDHVLMVAKSGGDFNTINAAIESIVDEVSNTNRYCILVFPGSYEEQIVYENIHGLSIIGVDRDSVIIHYDGAYPNCVCHVGGDITFRNLSIVLDNTNTYAVHCDVSNLGYTGEIIFNGCYIEGGTNAFGIGTGNNYNVTISDCILTCHGDYIIYAHNNPYSNTPNQHLTITNNLFKIVNSNGAIELDDAANSAGNSNSVLWLLIANNYSNEDGRTSVLFRKNTYDAGQNVPYFPRGDANIKFSYNCKDNANITGANYNEGYYQLSFYFVLPNKPDTAGTYITSIPVFIDANNYKLTLNSVTLPGVGDVGSNFSVSSAQLGCFNIETKSESYAGQALSATVTLTCPN